MGVLKNPKHEAFCQARALGRTLEEAYADAGYKPSRQHAQRLATKGYIKDRLKELQNHVVEKFEITVELITKMLKEDRAFARKCKVPSAAVQATMGLAKVAGLLVEHATLQVSHSYSSMTLDEIRFELAALNAEARSLKPGVQH